ncbi:porin [Bacteroides sp. 224]|uniref:porin n=1 Tax=Bacteroides sp. 224 TaxID=2302936 RepID=UPI0013D5BF3D|nr:porin [Bacteroides sp. 224]
MSCLVANSQEGDLKISGYVQAQWVWDESGIESGDQNKFSVRRGRLKAAYSNKYGEAVMQIDVTEEGVDIKDAYLKGKIPEIGWLAFRAGIFDRPFGAEISYSSSRRESPERSRIFQTLFPKERDLGAEIVLRGLEGSFLKDFTLNAGVFAGNGGQAKETDSGKDFIGHLAYRKQYKNMSFALGASLYYGGVRLAGVEGQKAYKLRNKEFLEDNSLSLGDYANRHYFGFDAQYTLSSILGTTNLRGEYLWGTQPGSKNGSKSPTGAITTDIYSRNFSGYYIQLVQDIGKSKHSLVAKLDGYDPNTKLSKDGCLTIGDVSYTTVGLGWLFRINPNLRMTAYYEMTSNEKIKNDWMEDVYSRNVNDDVFTLRLQYKF